MTKASYTEMVDPAARDGAGSGIEWIGKIPKGWEVMKVSHVFQVNRGRVIDKTQITEDPENDYIYPVYSSQTHKDGCLGYIQTYDYNKDSITWTTDGANAGSVFFRQGKFNATNVCGILTLLDTKQNYQYLTHALRLAGLVNRREDVLGYKLMSNEMAAIKFPLPPVTTQQAIASYLDTKTAQIDEAISLKTQQIELLREKRTTLVNHVVTKGLDPDVELVDSGIEWIGTIPKGWYISKMNRMIDVRDGTHDTPGYVGETEGIPFVTSKDLSNGKLCFDEVKYVSIEDHDQMKKRSHVEEGDILMAMIGTIGNPCIVDVNFEFSIKNVALFKPKKISNKYLFYYLCSDVCKNYLTVNESGGIQKFVGLGDLRSMGLILPSSQEQQAVASYLDTKTAEIDQTVALVQKSIDLLVEYKQSLISHVVTGKVKVG